MHQYVKFPASQSDCNKMESTFSLMPPQRLSEKVQLKKNRPKIQNCNWGQIRNVCLVNHLKVSSRKVKSCCYKNSDGKSTFNIHCTWAQDKVKGEHLKKLPKIQNLEFFTKLNTRHTIWSWLIKSVNMKWMRLVLWLRHSGHDSVHRQTDGLCETSVPHFNFVELWISIIKLPISIIALWEPITTHWSYCIFNYHP